MNRILLIVLVFAQFSTRTSSAAERTEGTPLRVATVERQPFVFRRGQRVVGYSVDVLDQIAAELEVDYEFVVTNSFPEMLELVRAGSADLAIANISTTAEREQYLDFSHPVFASGLQIAIPTSANARAIPFAIFYGGFMRILATAGIVLLLVAHGLWFFERGSERDFRDRYLCGIWDAFWWAAVTVTTVGYGDKVPRSIGGRLVGIVWMFASLFLVTMFVAHATSALTNATVTGTREPGDLQPLTVATVEQSTADNYLTRHAIDTLRYATPAEMFAAVESGAADALVYDAPLVRHYVLHQGRHNMRLSGGVFQIEDYALALPAQSELRERINRAILSLRATGVVEDIRQQWFG